MSVCTHGLTVSPDTFVTDECQSCDWCNDCDSVQTWTGEVCNGCGRVWGACETCNADPCECAP